MNQPRKRVQAMAIVAAVVGLFAAAAIVDHFKAADVLAAMAKIGLGGFAVAIAAQVGLFLLLGPAWQILAPGEPASSAPVFIWSRLLREAASDVLPFSQLGGFVVSGRAAVLGGLSAGAAVGSSLVDATVEVAAQMIYTLVGLAVLAHSLGFAAGRHQLIYSVVGSVVLTGVLAGCMIGFQKPGLRLTEQLMHRLSPEAGAQAVAVTRAVERAYAERWRPATSLAVHVIGWFGAAGGSWLILQFIGRPLSFASVVGLESLMFAVRNTAFFAPSGLGVQEGAYALLGPLFGLPPEAALALSLLKRARDITIGVPMLLSWLALEGSRKAPRDAQGAAIVGGGGPRLNPGGSGDNVGGEGPRNRLRS